MQLDINQGSNHFDVRVVPSLDGLARRAQLQADNAANPAVAVKASAGASSSSRSSKKYQAPRSAHGGFFNPNNNPRQQPAVEENSNLIEDDIDWNFYLNLAIVSGGAMLVVGLLLSLPGLTITGACLLGAGVIGYTSSCLAPENENNGVSFRR